jgi:hypothetical protein
MKHRPAINGRGYETTPPKAGFSLRCSIALWLQPKAVFFKARKAGPEIIFAYENRPAINGRGYETTPPKAGFSLRCSIALWLQLFSELFSLLQGRKGRS